MRNQNYIELKWRGVAAVAPPSPPVFPVIYAAARTPNSFTITLRRQNMFPQSQSIRIPINELYSSNLIARSKATESELETESSPSNEIDCIGTGQDVECVYNPIDDLLDKSEEVRGENRETTSGLMELASTALEWGLLISPFFFWGTAMVAMKQVLPKTGPFVGRLRCFQGPKFAYWMEGLAVYLSFCCH